eukprot:gnl/MRDRNA2_/MRDRNA2_94171_c0_seq1.p3 gnl/MRDRNA2_/MRDRNA2_94171_c0~~gnl/MRDRNA2_/MRDRNA2_94171_c0_seq1.p3  ORF type:complete len:118 (+),score=18.28 gnl/MRDRNA2_/MRDRNA2_94171_c0_seq1:92-445(+)
MPEQPAATHSRPSLYFAFFLAAILFATENFGRDWLVERVANMRWVERAPSMKEVPLVHVPRKSFGHGTGPGPCHGDACLQRLVREDPEIQDPTPAFEVSLSGEVQMLTIDAKQRVGR